MDTKTLFQLSAEMSAIEDALWENGGEITEELALAMQETETSLAKKADGYNSLIRSFASKKDIISAEIERLTKLKKVAENAEKRVRQHILNTMETFGIEKIEGNMCKISISKTSSVVTDDELIISGYQRRLEEFVSALPPYIKAELKVSKSAIKEFQKTEGLLPSGAEIVENHTLRIR